MLTSTITDRKRPREEESNSDNPRITVIDLVTIKKAKVDNKESKNGLKSKKPESSSFKRNRALLITHFEQPFKLVEDHPLPELNENDILVENKAVGLNPIDWKGKKYGFGIYHFPWINGRESSGIVVKTGSSIKPDLIQNGDRVIVSSTSYRDNRTSTFQQYTAIDSRLVWKLPERFSFEDGATIGVGLATAGVILYDSFKFALKTDAEKLKGTIVIWGGATVVGLYLTQLAKIHGLKIISIASLDHQEYLEQIGSDHIVDRHLPEAKIIEKVLALESDINYGVDCVSKQSAESVIKILEKSSETSTSKPLFSAIVGKPKDITDSVDVRDVTIKNFHEDVQFGKNFVDLTTHYFDQDLVKPIRFKHYKGGLHLIDDALKDLERVGAKGEKFVVSL